MFGGKGSRRAGGTNRPCVIIDIVVAGETAQFRAMEKFCGGAISELPLHVQDVFEMCA